MIAALVIWNAWPSKEVNLLAIGNFAVLTLTLIVLVWYAYDTNLIARVTVERWQRDGVLSTTYSMDLSQGSKPGDAGQDDVPASQPVYT